MEWSTFLINAQPPGMSASECLANGVDYALLGEKMGMTTAWVLEHHFTRYGLVNSPLAYCAYLLGKTTTLKVGTAVQVIALDHPVRLAEQIALLDQLSGGRFIFGFGRGAFSKDFVVFDRDKRRTRDITEEWLSLMKTAWTTGSVGADSANIRFPEVPLNVPTLTKPYPQMYTVALSPHSIDYAARNNLPLIHAFGYPDSQTLAVMRRYNLISEKAGFDPSTVPHVLAVLAGTSTNGSVIQNASRERLTWWEEENFRADDLGERLTFEWLGRHADEVYALGAPRSAAEKVDRYFANSPIGTPQECIDRLNTTVEITGITRIALAFEGAGKRELVLDSMQQFIEEVIPQVRHSTGRIYS